jgi:hypothetical protein
VQFCKSSRTSATGFHKPTTSQILYLHYKDPYKNYNLKYQDNFDQQLAMQIRNYLLANSIREQARIMTITMDRFTQHVTQQYVLGQDIGMSPSRVVLPCLTPRCKLDCLNYRVRLEHSAAWIDVSSFQCCRAWMMIYRRRNKSNVMTDFGKIACKLSGFHKAVRNLRMGWQGASARKIGRCLASL